VDARIRKTVDLLKVQPTRKFKTSELAQAVNLSPWHFSHLFLQEMQASPHQFARQLRFEQARILLENSFLRVKEIMAAVGINDKSHFAKEFKRVYGMSPIQYRQRHINNDLKRAASYKRNNYPQPLINS
jgi:AraC-like DNA-binding protein